MTITQTMDAMGALNIVWFKWDLQISKLLPLLGARF
jgi:hypothetical protein